MKIYLVGYMGSGKSTIGPLLAEVLSYKFIDFDTYITQKEGMSISEIFKNKGEIYFRKAESTYLQQLLEEESEQVVVALGGGTPCYGTNLQVLKDSDAQTVYLNWHFKTLAQRLWSAKEERPLIASMQSYEDLEDYVRKHLFERGFYYNQSDLVLKIEDQSPQEVVDSIQESLF
ncbi:shikimate kinase [Dokdonia donghaensis]|uniref:shikimate kinase n=1 Tax=Dokdonia donghaensis TaxID=326320 RepID=UPI0035C7B652